MNCTACNKPLTKKYRRELTPLEWQKLQTAAWMKVAADRLREIGMWKSLLFKQTSHDKAANKKGRKCRS